MKFNSIIIIIKGDVIMTKVEEKIIDIINRLRPFLINDGGNIEFVKYEDHIAYIKMMGACANCIMLDATLKDGVEAMIKDEVPEVEAVLNIDE